VEGFFGVFATVVMAFLLSHIGAVSKKFALTTVYFIIFLYLGSGVIGTFHHLYWSGSPMTILALAEIRLGYVTITAPFSGLVLSENVESGEYVAPGTPVFSNLTPFKKRYAGNLSGGMKQKLGLACALIHTPEGLFLDEPTNGVDPVSRRDFWQILYQLLREKVTIFVSTAYLDETARCGRLGLIHNGKLLALGTPKDENHKAVTSPYFSLKEYARNYPQLERAIDSGEALAGLLIPRGFAGKIESGRHVSVQMIVDGSDSNTATIAMGYADVITMIYSQDLGLQKIHRLGGVELSLPLDMRPRVWFNEDLESKNYIIPGLIAMIMMVIAALLTFLTIAREWESGTMEQLISTPVKSRELILGKLLPYFAVGMFDVILAVVMGEFLFEVPLRGNVALLNANHPDAHQYGGGP
jgi:hypothetical protein